MEMLMTICSAYCASTSAARPTPTHGCECEQSWYLIGRSSIWRAHLIELMNILSQSASQTEREWLSQHECKH